MPGQDFRGHRVYSVLGHGGLGTAYLVGHPVLRVPRVAKLFRPLDDRDPFAEAHLAARVNSVHVVPVWDAGHDRGRPYVIQSYVDGLDVAELIRCLREVRRRVPLDTAVRLAAHTAAGLQAIHEAGVLHCDVKPANVFLRGDGVAAVGDFSLAVAAGRRNLNLGGSAAYMPPERWAADDPDQRSDLYSLGVMLHELATGSLPFTGDFDALRRAHLTQSYSPPQSTTPDEAYVFAVVAGLLAKDPAGRPGTAAELHAVFQRIGRPCPPLVRVGLDAYRSGCVQLSIRQGDLTRDNADVVVNAANPHLGMLQGVALAIREAGGPEIEREAQREAEIRRARGRPVALGDVVWTGAGSLPCRRVAHAVAALQGGANCLQRSFLRTLLQADVQRWSSLSLPALGTGLARIPMAYAAHLIVVAVQTFSTLGSHHLHDVRVVLRDAEDVSVWRHVTDSLARH